MTKRILVIQAHPDASRPHFCHALARAYLDSARQAGHEVKLIDIGSLDFPLLRSKAQWEGSEVPAVLSAAQSHIRWAEHIVFFYPLWLGGMPALLKGFLEQIARPGFAIGGMAKKELPKKLLAGRSARVVITMGMPTAVFRWFFFAHSLRALKRNILGFVGISPVHETLIGSVETLGEPRRARWLGEMGELGRAGV